MSPRNLARAALSALVLATLAVAQGCIGGWAGMAAAGGSGFAAGALLAGPTVALDNQSTTDLRITYWVGEVDSRSATGASGWRSDSDHNFLIEPGHKDTRRVGHDGFDASTADSIVRVRIQPAPGEAPGPNVRPTQHNPERTSYWLELEGPPPYRLRITGDADGLFFESYGEGGLRAVPTDEQFPYHNESQPTPTNPYDG